MRRGVVGKWWWWGGEDFCMGRFLSFFGSC